MKKKMDTSLGKNIEDLKLEVVVDNVLVCDTILRRRPHL